jgi:FemAB-related protein (PEP-CTERM system-associated)
MNTMDPATLAATNTVVDLPLVHCMREADMPRWDEFVAICPEATFFHRAGWQPVIERTFGHRTWFLYAERAGRITGILALAQVKSHLFGHSLCSLPFCTSAGVAAIDEGSRVALDEAAQQLATRLMVGHLEYRHTVPRHSDWQGKDLYVTFRKTLEGKVEDNLNAIPRKQRAMIRKGIKAGLESHIDDNVDRLFDAYSRSVHRLGTPVFPKKYFRNLMAVFGKDCEVLTVTKDGRTICSVLSFYFRDEVLPYYGGGTPEARELAGNDFMYWELMRRACERGIRVFDFGRSKRDTGAFDFKKNWGFEPTQLYYEYQLHGADAIPDNNPLNPKYQRMIKMWRRLPLFAANALGPLIVKHLG